MNNDLTDDYIRTATWEFFRPCPPVLRSDTALFLDLDGTLAEFESHPDLVCPSSDRDALILGVSRSLSGAVAVITGRSLPDADRILSASLPAVAGIHGLIRRLPDGSVAAFKPADELLLAKRTMLALAKSEPGLLVEDKGSSIAVHYRQNPGAESAVRKALAFLSGSTGLVLQEGSMVSELRTPGPTKGDALRSFMADPPFRGRLPVAVGDDLTDEHAFTAAEQLGGYGILVGPARETAARYRLGSVAEVLAWLKAGCAN